MKAARFLFVLALVVLPVWTVAAQTNGKYEQPILITSAGQSADVTMAGMICKKLNLNAKVAVLAKPADLEGIKTLLVVPGFSSKGLGSAGTSREDELARTKELLAAAKEKKLPVVMLHLGGKPRRGQQSDDFNQLAAEASQNMIVVKQADEDQFFSKIAAEKKIPIALVAKIADTMAPLKALFP